MSHNVGKTRMARPASLVEDIHGDSDLEPDSRDGGYPA
ncbi:hypothetical protein ART_0253 [Arthrobacter sp. PAMC 25486]|nr:hypothetical protein ART_0253 [Arthrobacter sp. PAMC 25486]